MGIVQASITQTVFYQNPVSIFAVLKVFLPREIFGKEALWGDEEWKCRGGSCASRNFVFVKEFTFSGDPTNPSLLSFRFPRGDLIGCSRYWRTKNRRCCCSLL
uniref:Uncharacterized protein n=1 Tax=Nelumbo nucifera TaxID=4432 RepID=A0A822Z9E3_NELNU|nr:TPA_asm: hypothetical protein HUJ06_015985 [Nelumbo nucifera]